MPSGATGFGGLVVWALSGRLRAQTGGKRLSTISAATDMAADHPTAIGKVTMKNKHRTVHLSFAFVVGFALLAFLAWSLSACRASGQEALPRLLAVIEMPPGIGLTAQGVIHPNGKAYILNQSGSIAVLNGPRLITIITELDKVRNSMTDLAVSGNGGYVYVTDLYANTLDIIRDTTVVSTISSIGPSPVRVVVHPKTGYVYVANIKKPGGEGTVTVISGTTVITDVQVGYMPRTLLVNPVNGLVYVGQTRPSSNKHAKMLAIIRGTELITQTNLGLDIYGSITDIAVNPNTGEMYMIPNYGTLIYWDGAQDVRMIDMYRHGKYSLNNVAVDTKRNWAYVSSWDGPPSHVAVVNKDKVIADIEVPGYDLRGIVYDATHDYIYVANRLSGTMSIIRGTEVITTVSTGGMEPAYITVDENRGYIYVSNTFSHSVAVFGYEAKPQETSARKHFLPFCEIKGARFFGGIKKNQGFPR